MLKVLELCAGISADERAFLNLNIEHQIVDSVENDPKVVKIRNAMYGTNFQPKDIVNYHYNGEVDLIIGGTPCFTGEMKVLTNQGYQQIKDIQIRDKVLTHQNTWERVINIFNQGEKEIWEVVLSKNIKIKTTLNHKFYIYNPNTQIFEWKELQHININQDYFTQPIIKDEIPFYNDDPNFWYLCGRYLADGWTKQKNNHYSIVICANQKKVGYLKERIEKVYHISSHTHERTVDKLFITNKELTNFILNNFGHLAKNKFISQNVLNLPKNCLQELVKGYYDGDGSLVWNGTKRYSSINENLLLSIQLILLKLGISSSLYKDIRPKTTIIEDRVVNQNDTFELRENSKGIFINGYYCVNAMNILNTHLKETVYDIEVANSHSFTVENYLVHNCQDISLAGLQKGAVKDTRSALIWEQLRIFLETRPKYYIWENVKNLLSRKHRPILDEHNKFIESLGYQVCYQVLNAKDFGIPQSRERVFVVAIRNDIHQSFDFNNLIKTPMKPLREFLQTPRLKDYIYLDKQKYITKRIKEQKVKLIDYLTTDSIFGILTTQPYRDNLDNGALLENIDTWYYIKNSYKWFLNQMHSQEKIEWMSNQPEDFKLKNIKLLLGDLNDTTQTITTGMGKWKGSFTSIIEPTETKTKHLKLPFHTFENANNVHPLSDDVPLRTITTNTSRNGTTEKILDNQIKEFSNFVVFPRAKDNQLISGGYNRAWKTESDNSFVGTTTVANQPRILDKFKDTSLLVVKWNEQLWNVRILTELECFRLMGFTDNDFLKAQQVGTRTMLYHVAGNSIVVPVLESIFKELGL